MFCILLRNLTNSSSIFYTFDRVEPTSIYSNVAPSEDKVNASEMIQVEFGWLKQPGGILSQYLEDPLTLPLAAVQTRFFFIQ